MLLKHRAFILRAIRSHTRRISRKTSFSQICRYNGAFIAGIAVTTQIIAKFDESGQALKVLATRVAEMQSNSDVAVAYHPTLNLDGSDLVLVGMFEDGSSAAYPLHHTHISSLSLSGTQTADATAHVIPDMRGQWYITRLVDSAFLSVLTGDKIFSFALDVQFLSETLIAKGVLS